MPYFADFALTECLILQKNNVSECLILQKEDAS